MSRYIDADKLSSMLQAKADTLIEGKEAFLYVAKWLGLIPTADVAEVKHGHWTGMDGDQCSNCGKSLRDLMDGDSYYSSEFEYRGFDALVACPFCGAKMDGERKEE